MRARLIILVLAILAVAGFAAQNWPEFTRTSSLNFGILTAELPLGLILLSLLGLALLVFAAVAGSMRTQSLVESRQHTKTLNAQRELADKAEASRFTELRQVLDRQQQEARQRETAVSAGLEKSLGQQNREMRTQLEQLGQSLTARLTDMERKLDSRGARDAVVTTRTEPSAPDRVTEVQAVPGRERV